MSSYAGKTPLLDQPYWDKTGRQDSSPEAHDSAVRQRPLQPHEQQPESLDCARQRVLIIPDTQPGPQIGVQLRLYPDSGR